MDLRRSTHSRKHVGLIFFISLIVSLFLFRHALLETGVHAAMRLCLPKQVAKSVHYEEIAWEEGKLLISGMNVKDEKRHFAIDRLEISFQFDLLRLHVQPKLLLVHPEITLVQKEPEEVSAAGLAALIPTRFYTIKLDVQNGVLQLDNSKQLLRLYFAFRAGLEKEKIGSLSLSYDPGLESLPLAVVDISMEKEVPVFQWKIPSIECARLLQLAGFFYPQVNEGWENVQGLVEVSGKGSADHLDCRFDVNHLVLDHSRVGLHAQAVRFEGEFSYPPPDGALASLPIWKQIFARAGLEGGELRMGDWGVRGAAAQLLLDPHTDPVLELTGVFLHGKESFPLLLQGKGAVHEDSSFWLELGLKFAETAVGFVSVCSPEKERYVIQAEMENVLCAHLQMLPIPLSEGLIRGKAIAWIEGSALQRIQLDGVTAEGVRLAESNIFIQQIKADGSLSFQEDSPLSLQIEAHSTLGDLGLASDYAQKLALFSTLRVKEKGYAILGTLQAQEEKIEFGCDLAFSLKGGWVRAEKLTPVFYLPIFKKFYPEADIEGDCDLFGTFDAKGIQLSLQVSDLLIQHPAFCFQVEKIGSKDPHLLQTEGRAVFSYEWGKGRGYGMIPLVQATAVDKGHDLYVEGITGKLQFDGSHFWVEELSARCEQLSLQGQVYLHHSAPEVYELTVHTSQLNGEIASVHKLLQQCGIFSLSSSPRGKIESGKDGLIFSLRLAPADAALQWRLKARMKEASYPLDDKNSLSDLDAQVEFDSATGEVVLSELRGKLQVSDQASEDVYMREIRGSHRQWSFEGSLADKIFLAGRAELLSLGEIDVLFDPERTHFMGTKLAVSRLLLKKEGRVSHLEMAPELHGETLHEQIAFLTKMGWIPPLGFSLEGCQGRVHTSIHYLGDQETLTFTADGTDLQIMGKPVHQFALKGERTGPQWIIENLQLDDLLITTSFIEQNGGWVFPQFELTWKQAALKAAGIYSPERKQWVGAVNALDLSAGAMSAHAEGPVCVDLGSRFSVKGELNLALTAAAPLFVQAKSGSRIKYVLTAERGLEFSDVDLCVEGETAAQGVAQEIRYDWQTAKWTAKKLQFSLSKEMLAAAAQAGVLPSFAASLDTFTGVAEAEYSPTLRLLNISCATRMHAQPLYVQLQLDHQEQMLGMLKVQEHAKAPGLKLLFKEKACESIQGNLYGLNVDLVKNAEGGLWGSVQIDFGKLSPLLSKPWQEKLQRLKLGGGFELEGNWSGLGQFQGVLRGQAIDLFGYRLDRLETELEFSAERGLAHQLLLQDEAGVLQIKRLQFYKEPSAGRWRFEAPYVQVEHFRPSVLRSCQASQKPLKPLVIKNLSLLDFSGYVDEPATYSGRGAFHFTNAFKKEFNLFEASLDLVKDLGLDPGLFTPIYGEIEYRIKEGKCVLTDLKNAYSEGKRSQFYLAGGEDSSYFDLTGNKLHVNIRMRQDVLLNITEPFILSVRGTLEKPRYSLVK